MQAPFRETWKLLDCAHDDFIRTTEPRHKQRAQALWQRIAARGDIYLGEYEDWYCVGCETFYTEKDLLPGNICPQHLTSGRAHQGVELLLPPEQVPAAAARLLRAHPDFVKPAGRFNEVKSFVREGLRGSVGVAHQLRWGMPVPNDPEHVMYVWFDALANYMSALGGPAEPGDSPLYDRFWPPHGSDAHRRQRHPALSRGVLAGVSAGRRASSRRPRSGRTAGSRSTAQKMSKSLGNFLAPEPLVEAFGVDALRYYLMRDIAFGQDGDFSHAQPDRALERRARQRPGQPAQPRARQHRAEESRRARARARAERARREDDTLKRWLRRA